MKRIYILSGAVDFDYLRWALDGMGCSAFLSGCSEGLVMAVECSDDTGDSFWRIEDYLRDRGVEFRPLEPGDNLISM